MTSAGHRVAHIPELLESILPLLLEDFDPDNPQTYRPTCKTVLASQRACTAFRDTIVASKKLKQALMLAEPSKSPTCHAPSVNPLAKLFMECRPVTPPPQIPCKDWQTPCYSLWVYGDGERTRKRRRVEPSYRKMYLYSKPYTVVAASGFHADGIRRRPEFVLKNPTLGNVLDIAHGKRKHEEGNYQ